VTVHYVCLLGRVIQRPTLTRSASFDAAIFRPIEADGVQSRNIKKRKRRTRRNFPRLRFGLVSAQAAPRT
jgi:hypothetical protein